MTKLIFGLMTTAIISIQLMAMPIPNDERKAVYDAGQKLGGVFKRKPFSKTGSPKTLVICGQRPWLGKDVAKNLAAAGCDVNLIDGPYLGGLSGTYIRHLPHDPVEPKPLDAITPEFNHLGDYELIFVNGISLENQEKLFTPDRIEKLKKYLNDGGTLVLTINAPARLGDILPVQLGDKNPASVDLFVRRPDTPAFAELPETWQLTDSYRDAALADGATQLAPIIDDAGREVGIFVASKPYGKGKVLFANVENVRIAATRSFHRWAYNKMFFVSLASEASGKKLSTAHTVFKKQQSDPPKTIAHCDLKLTGATMKLSDDKSLCILPDDTTISFSNGMKVKIINKRTLDIYLPGSNRPYLTGVRIPELILTSKLGAIEDSSAEAVGMKSVSKKLKTYWKLTEVKPGETATLVWTAKEGTVLEQEIKTAKLDIDGKLYHGVAIRAKVVKSDKMISGFDFEQRVDVGNQKIRRLAVYAHPRGYAEYDLTDKKDDDTKSWGIFSSGQPFGWIEGSEGVYTAFVGDIMTSSMQIKQKAGAKCAEVTLSNTIGFKKAPQTSAWWYHLVGPADAADNNGWMAIYQFMRHYLRKKANLPEVPAYPSVTFASDSKEERAKIIENAGEAEMHSFHLPACPSTMESIDHPNRLAAIKQIVDAGLVPHVWSPCGHSHGTSDWIKAQKHWLAYQENGKPFTYFGGDFPVIDQSNPDFLKWYIPKVQRSIDAGLRGFWYDMGGAATATRNFAKEQDDTGLKVLVEVIYPLFYDQGGWIATEGTSPLVLDGFWYRAQLYASMANREFAFIGAFPTGEGFDFDYIRSSMYGTFYTTAFDNYKENFERVPGEIAHLNDMAHYTKFICEVLDSCGMPFIRETDFGTSWISDKAGALFFYNAVDDFHAELPDGFIPVKMITEKERNIPLNGKMPVKVPQRSIILLKKVK